MELLNELIIHYPSLSGIKNDILLSYEIIIETYTNGGKLLCCGNGGSCSDCGHIVGELMKNFRLKRGIKPELKEKLLEMEKGDLIASKLEGALPAISLCEHNSLSSAYSNDTEPQFTYAQQLLGYGKSGDVLLAISTSGNSQNCIYAAMTAKAMGIKVISMTGSTGGQIKKYSDVLIAVPENETYRIQEYHLPIYHCLCAMTEQYFFS